MPSTCVGVIRTVTRCSPGLPEGVRVGAEVLLGEPVDVVVGALLDDLRRSGNTDPAVHLGRIDDDDRDARVGADVAHLALRCAGELNSTASSVASIQTTVECGEPSCPERRHGADERVVLQERALRVGELSHGISRSRCWRLQSQRTKGSRLTITPFVRDRDDVDPGD